LKRGVHTATQQKVYLTQNCVSLNQLSMVPINANTGSTQENSRSEAQALRQNMQGLRSKKRRNRDKMQEMPHQEPSLEEARNRKVIDERLFYRILYRLSILKAVFAHPFFMSGTFCPTTFIALRKSPPALTSSPHATPTIPS
jgi:hypothetical protein